MAPLKQMFHFMQPLPELGSPTALGLKEIAIRHIFGFQQPAPQFI
jgi:hypothetical protein